jgi:hypothetical protein
VLKGNFDVKSLELVLSTLQVRGVGISSSTIGVMGNSMPLQDK